MQSPSQAMAAFQPGMVPTVQAQQQHQQTAAGRASQPHMASQAHMASQGHMAMQQVWQPGMQQPGYSPGPSPHMYVQQAGMQQQQQQACTSRAPEQLSCHLSPPNLPYGPSQPAISLQRAGTKSRHHQSANKPGAHLPFTRPPTSATAAPASVQAPTASWTPSPPPSGLPSGLPSGMTQQAEGTRAKGSRMGLPRGQPAGANGRCNDT